MLILCPLLVFGQAKKKLYRNICSATDDEKAPYVSADGKAIVFMLKDNFKGVWSIEYSRKRGSEWERSQPIDVVNKSQRNNQMGGYCLSADGNTLYFTSRKYGGVRYSDIWVTRRNPASGTWSEPKNLAMPVNSDMHDGNPSVSPDGKYLYFMRCSSLSNDKSECCKIYVSESRGKDLWKAPVALPAPINTGCESTPRIMADGKTLFFASKRSGGKGNLDIYMSKKNGNSWSKPVPASFLNTSKDDQYVSMTARNNLVFYGTEGEETLDLYKAKLPANLRPSVVKQVEGIAKDSKTGKPLKVIATATNLKTGAIDFKVLTEKDGRFELFLIEGNDYDVAFNTLDKKHTFYSTRISTKGMTKFERERLKIEMHPVHGGEQLFLNSLTFDAKGNITPESEYELKRLLTLVKKSPNFHYELVCFDTEIESDTIKRPELTEVIADTVITTEIIDSVETEVEKINYTYHNDLTPKWEKNLNRYMKQKKVPGNKIKVILVQKNTSGISRSLEGVTRKKGVVLKVLKGA